MRIKNLLCKPRGGETAANKPRTRRSLTSTSGSLFVEAAILFPVAVFALMGTIETMNVYLQRGSVINVANSIAMAIQQNPDITAQKMYEFQKSLGGGVTPFREINISDGSPYTGTTPCSVADCRVTGLDIRIGASATPVREPDIRDLAPSDWSSPHVSKLPGQANPAWPNAASPLKADPNQSAADDANAYYVGVRVAWQNRPIFTRLGFASVTTTQFAGVVVRKKGLLAGDSGGFGEYGQDSVSWEKTISLEEDAILTLSCSSGGWWDNLRNGCRATGTAGWVVSALVDGQECSKDNSWSVYVSRANFYASTTCIRKLGPGPHTLKCLGQNYGDGGHCHPISTKSLPGQDHNFGYTVTAR